jgi:hypothetical protein
MYRFVSFVILSLFAFAAFAKPCVSNTRSCLMLKNDSNYLANIKCNGLEAVSAPNKSEGSTQLDSGFGDGMGAPEPRSMYCQLTVGETTKPFNFYNPYWGSAIAFHVTASNLLMVEVTDGGSAEAKTHYEFDLMKDAKEE